MSINLTGAIDAGRSAWRVSASHFAERHALFVIIALGESIVAIGVGAANAERGLTLAAAIIVALAGTIALWWAYFEFVAMAMERMLKLATDHTHRGRLARDVFTFCHFPLIAGIVLFAVAAKKAVTHGDEPLSDAGRFALGAGIGIYLLAFVAVRLRLIRRLAWERVGAAAVIAVVAWLADGLAASALIGVVVAVLATAIGIESARLREVRTGLKATL